MSDKVPYSVAVRRATNSGRANGAAMGMIAYAGALVAAPASFFGSGLVLNAVVLFGGLMAAGVAGAVAGAVVAGSWSAVMKSPTMAQAETPAVSSEDVGMTHKVQLSSDPKHVAYVHEGRVVETQKGQIKAAHGYQDYIEESNAMSDELDDFSR